MAACRSFVAARLAAAISNTRGYAPICSDLGTSAQKCPKSERAVRSPLQASSRMRLIRGREVSCALAEAATLMDMTRFSVKIEGAPLIAAMTSLNGAGLPTLGAGAHWGSAPPPDWDLTSLRAVFDAASADEARRMAEAALPAEGSYKIAEPESLLEG
jgi:hypothetical protein